MITITIKIITISFYNYTRVNNIYMWSVTTPCICIAATYIISCLTKRHAPSSSHTTHVRLTPRHAKKHTTCPTRHSTHSSCHLSVQARSPNTAGRTCPTPQSLSIKHQHHSRQLSSLGQHVTHPNHLVYKHQHHSQQLSSLGLVAIQCAERGQFIIQAPAPLTAALRPWPTCHTPHNHLVYKHQHHSQQLSSLGRHVAHPNHLVYKHQHVTHPTITYHTQALASQQLSSLGLAAIHSMRGARSIYRTSTSTTHNSSPALADMSHTPIT